MGGCRSHEEAQVQGGREEQGNPEPQEIPTLNGRVRGEGKKEKNLQTSGMDVRRLF